jgi:hypothetical protein
MLTTKYNRVKLLLMSFVCLFSVLGLSGGWFAPTASAISNKGEHISITLSPTQAHLELAPGATTAGEFTVRNTGTVPYDFKVYATPYYVDSNYENVFNKPNSMTELANWIKFEGEVNKSGELIYHLEPEEVQLIKYNILVPNNVQGGGQYAALFAEILPGIADESGIVAVRQIATHVYAKIAGNATVKGNVVDREIGFWHGSSEVKTSLVLQNDGNIDYDATNTLIVKTLTGKVIYESEAASVNVMPGVDRKVELTWNSPRPIGVYQVTQETVMNGQTFEKESLVIVLPIYIIIIGLVALTAIIYLVRLKIVGRRGERVRAGSKTGKKSDKPSLWARLEARRLAKEERKNQPKAPRHIVLVENGKSPPSTVG